MRTNYGKMRTTKELLYVMAIKEGKCVRKLGEVTNQMLQRDGGWQREKDMANNEEGHLSEEGASQWSGEARGARLL